MFFWGDPRPYVQDAHRHGIKVFLQVGSVEEAQSAVEAGVDGIIAQGLEAGGHVKSTTALSSLVPAVVEAVQPVPVIAADGGTSGGTNPRISAGSTVASDWLRLFPCTKEKKHHAELKKVRPTLDIGSHINVKAQSRAVARRLVGSRSGAWDRSPGFHPLLPQPGREVCPHTAFRHPSPHGRPGGT